MKLESRRLGVFLSTVFTLVRLLSGVRQGVSLESADGRERLVADLAAVDAVASVTDEVLAQLAGIEKSFITLWTRVLPLAVLPHVQAELER